MKLIQPFPGWRPRSGLAQRVAAPPYDVLSSAEARHLVRGNPDSFLHVSKAEIDLDPTLSPYDELVYQTAKARFLAMRYGDDGGAPAILQQDSVPCLYVYRLATPQRQQVGVVAAVAVTAYLDDRIRKHELTRLDKEQDRTRLAAVLEAHTGPAFLTYRHFQEIDALVARVQNTTPPTESFWADDGVQHTLWVVADSPTIAALVDCFEQQPLLYIADGHHRSAAAARVYAKQPAADRLLCVLFPDNQVQILSYNRVVKDLHGHTPQTLLRAIGDRFQVTVSASPVQPDRRHCFGMFLDGHWYRLELAAGVVDEADPVASLDVSLLSQHLLHPLLGISDPRRDQRIDFVGGGRGLAGLMEPVQSGNMAVAFSLFPTQLTELMAVADQNQIMPPKSTWFEPKLRDGLVVQTF